jgi:hypothetical protein
VSDLDAYTVNELIAAGSALEDRVDGMFDRLSRITGRAGSAANGIEVTVNLEGMLIGLELTGDAVALGAGRLAEEIFRLTQEASGAALAKGIAILEPVAGDELTSELAELVGIRTVASVAEVPEQPAGPLDDREDFSTVYTWALP